MAGNYSDAQNRATQKYQLKAYDRISFRVKKGEKEKLEMMAQAEGKSLNQFIYDKCFGEGK